MVDRNWRVSGGEIDLVLSDGVALVFCEVKTRSDTRFGSGLEAVTPVKQARLRKLGMQWLDAQRDAGAQHPRQVRFDVAALTLTGPRPGAGPASASLQVVEGAF